MKVINVLFVCQLLSKPFSQACSLVAENAGSEFWLVELRAMLLTLLTCPRQVPRRHA